MSDDCKLCRANPLISKHLASGQMDISDAMIEFHMTEEQVIEHLNEHDVRVVERPKITMQLMKLNKNPSQEEVTNYLYNLINELQNWIEWMQEYEQMDKSTLDMMLKIVDRIMKGMDHATKLQGYVSDGPKIQNNYVQVQGDMKMLTNVVVNRLCPDCKIKMIDAMDALQLTDGS